MTIPFRNTNELWAFILTETLKRLGLTCAIICPGSRSTPLAVAFEQTPSIEVISILDERSAAFFALGRAKATGIPAAVICTSGTAGANFYPAVIEANESRVPLLLLTADRPAELRNCHSGQTIDQVKLYGNYPNWQAELAVPVADIGMLGYLRQTLIHAWERTLSPIPGPVHLNIPLRDPLAPLPDGVDLTDINSKFDPENFFSHIKTKTPSSRLPTPDFQLPTPDSQRGIIIAGVAQPQNPKEYCSAIASLAETLNFPVLAEGLSPIRNYANLNKNIISAYDLILRNPKTALQLTPEIVIQIGDMPTSKELRTWLMATQPQYLIIDKTYQNLDPLHGKTTHLRISIEELGKVEREKEKGELLTNYIKQWLTAEIAVRSKIDEVFINIDTEANNFLESKIAWLLPQILPQETPIFIANSMPVRDIEFFWKPNQLGIQPFFNRGANGIDGTLSTALGVAHRNQSSIMLTGDLALLHDTNGFLIRHKLVGHLTILLINNNGGGIFEMLPIAQFEPPFEELFATPQDIDFAQLAATYGIEHRLITSWQELQEKLNPLPKQGIRILEIRTNRKADAKWRKENLGKFSQS